jgi:hypothetical protein
VRKSSLRWDWITATVLQCPYTLRLASPTAVYYCTHRTIHYHWNCVGSVLGGASVSRTIREEIVDPLAFEDEWEDLALGFFAGATSCSNVVLYTL